jgi:hypothetical protein
MVLLVQAIPYMAAVIMSIISAFAPLPTKLIDTITALPASIPPDQRAAPEEKTLSPVTPP